ncbi:MAG: ComEC/Rec2 family competence protein [Alphaproteobacteria bacterium]|nr:ComEC/Rec2 family competence protein [Alphaproteobacteria bacterium]
MKRSLLDTIGDFFESEKYRLSNFVPVCVGIGICCYFSLDSEPSIFANLCVFCTTLFIFILFKILERKKIDDYFVLCNVANSFFSSILLIAFGVLIAQLRTNCVNTFMLNEDVKKPISFVATIESCEKTEKGHKFIVSDIRRKYGDRAGELCKQLNKLHLIWIGKNAKEITEDYVPGSNVLFRAILSPIRTQAFPGAYDFRKQQYFKGISARGFIVKKPKILHYDQDQTTIRIYIEQLRHKINKKIEKYLSNNTAAIAKALVTGNTAGITKKIRANFSASGTAHLLAISGLHIGIIGFFIFWLCRVLLCFFPSISMFFDTKKIAGLISWLVVLLYLQISGCSVSSIRAFIMYTIVILAILFNRTPLTMRSVAIAATVIMLYTPEVIMFPSFQMSFGAVIAIISYVESGMYMPKFLKWLSETIIITIIASVPTSIISVSVFNQLTLNSILANIVCIPLMTFFIMPMLIFSLFLMLFGLSQPIIFMAGYGIDLLAKIAEETAKLPGSLFIMPTPSNAIFGIIVISFLLFTLIQHRIRYIGFLGVFCGIFLYIIQPLPDIFVAPYAKVIGIRTEDGVFFSHLGYFHSMTDSWSRSVGFDKRYNFKSKYGMKYIKKIDNYTYEIKLKGKKIIAIDYRYFNDDIYQADFVFILNGEKNENSALIYLASKKIKFATGNNRPWG